MRMRTRILSLLLCILTALLLHSCAVHEWPEAVPADATLKLDFNTALPQYTVLEYTTKSSKESDDYNVRYIVEAYRKTGDNSFSESPYKRFVFTKDDVSDLNTEVTVNIDEGTYDFYVWTDFTEKGSSEDFFYDCRNFRTIKLQGQHEGSNDFRDAFVGHKVLTVERYGKTTPPVSGTIEMERPLAKFEFITTDLQEFITKVINELMRKEAEKNAAAAAAEGTSVDTDDDNNDTTNDDTKKGGDSDEGGSKSPVVDLGKYNVVFYYTGYMPSTFNMRDNKPCDSRTGVEFKSEIELIDSQTARIGFDYVFVNGNESSVMVAVGIFDEEGTRLSVTGQIEVPIKRSMLTTVKGSFLMQSAGSGAIIDPSFDGEYNIVIH